MTTKTYIGSIEAFEIASEWNVELPRKRRQILHVGLAGEDVQILGKDADGFYTDILQY